MALRPGQQGMLAGAIKRCALRFHGKLAVGSLCTGTDVAAKVMDALSEFVCTEYEVDLAFVQVLQCESDPDKQNFLKAHSLADMMVSKVSDLIQGPKALDLLTDTEMIIPHVDVVASGFPCTSRTPVSCNSAKLKGCVQKGIGDTGRTYQEIRTFFSKARPSLVFLENVKELLQVVEETGISDA
eukprot:7028912-Pyramimonas_sp.AAC.1